MFQEIEQLSNPYLAELQNFIRYLKFKQTSQYATSINKITLPPENDPILCLISIADVTPSSETLDESILGVKYY